MKSKIYDYWQRVKKLAHDAQFVAIAGILVCMIAVPIVICIVAIGLTNDVSLYSWYWDHKAQISTEAARHWLDGAFSPDFVNNLSKKLVLAFIPEWNAILKPDFVRFALFVILVGFLAQIGAEIAKSIARSRTDSTKK
jgi:hypothetical protein